MSHSGRASPGWGGRDAGEGAGGAGTSAAATDALVRQLQARVAELEAENARLKQQLAAVQGGNTAAAVSSPESGHTRPPALPRRSASDGGVPSTLPAATPAAAAAPASAASASSASICDNCGKDVPPAALTMHKLHCARNIKRCEHCKAALSLKEHEAHVAEKVVVLSGAGKEAGFDKVFAALAAGDVAKLEDMLSHGLPGGAPLEWPLRVGAAVSTAEGSETPRPQDGDTLLHAAVRARQLDVIDFLLTRGGVSPNVRTAAGETALHIACALPRLPAPVAQAAAPTGPASGGVTPPTVAATPSAPSPVPAAAAATPHLSRSSSLGASGFALPPASGSTTSSTEPSPRLVFGPADFAAPAQPATPTGAAAAAAAAAAPPAGGSPAAPAPAGPMLPSAADVVAVLIKRGCDVEARTALGDTPLHIAQRSRNHEVVLLFTAGGGSSSSSGLASGSGAPLPLGRPPSRELRSLRPGSAGGSMRRGSLGDGLSLAPLGDAVTAPGPATAPSPTLGLGIGLGAASLVRSSSGLFSSGGPVAASHKLPVTASPPQA